MKKIVNLFSALLLTAISCMLTSCDFLNDLLGDNDLNNKQEYFDSELESSTGKWLLQDDTDTYFTFDGSKNVMTYSYVEDGISKYSGTYRVVSRGTGKDVLTPLTFIFTRSDKDKEDWIGCYVEDFDSDFTQFTIMSEEDLGIIDGSIHTYIYRISELPYKMGSYILEGNEYEVESDNYKYSNQFCIPSGTYTLETGEKFIFLYTKPVTNELFQYINGETIIEGTITIAEDKKTIYLYIENDPYNKVADADKEHYDTTFGIYYPPDFYLRGDFSNPNKIVINDLYHHIESPSEIEDSTWVFGTYNKN
ncbi:MAG: hypothetical protein SOW55_04260 [Bacilli bacterium]|nr:hypothetical protein [Bacilli bacterium]